MTPASQTLRAKPKEDRLCHLGCQQRQAVTFQQTQPPQVPAGMARAMDQIAASGSGEAGMAGPPSPELECVPSAGPCHLWLGFHAVFRVPPESPLHGEAGAVCWGWVADEGTCQACWRSSMCPALQVSNINQPLEIHGHLVP